MAVDGRALILDLQLVNERVQMNAEGIMGERLAARDENLHMRSTISQIQELVATRPSYSMLPISPNLLKDTKKFEGLCRGALNRELAWYYTLN